jgi:hypothetical protein
MNGIKFTTRPKTLLPGLPVKVVGYNGARYDNGERKLTAVDAVIISMKPNALHVQALALGQALDKHCFDYTVDGGGLGTCEVSASAINAGDYVSIPTGDGDHGFWVDENHPAARLMWLRFCLHTNRRAGKRRPITTENQRHKILASIETARADLIAAGWAFEPVIVDSRWTVRQFTGQS